MKKLRKSFFTGFQAGIEAIDANVAVIDRNWDIVLTNASWREFGEQNGYNSGQTACTPGGSYENYFEVLKRAIPLAMILNELVSNACKHAFPDKTKGHLHIRLSENEGCVNLTVKDNGTGCDFLDNSMDVKKLGATLIELLSAQLQSELKLHVNGGTQVSIRFEKEHKEVQAV